jgi:hypothetical protein
MIGVSTVAVTNSFFEVVNIVSLLDLVSGGDRLDMSGSVGSGRPARCDGQHNLSDSMAARSALRAEADRGVEQGGLLDFRDVTRLRLDRPVVKCALRD